MQPGHDLVFEIDFDNFALTYLYWSLLYCEHVMSEADFPGILTLWNAEWKGVGTWNAKIKMVLIALSRAEAGVDFGMVLEIADYENPIECYLAYIQS